MSVAISTCSASVGWPQLNSLRRPHHSFSCSASLVGEADELEHRVGGQREGELVDELGRRQPRRASSSRTPRPGAAPTAPERPCAGSRSPWWCGPAPGRGRAARCSTSPGAGRSPRSSTDRAAGAQREDRVLHEPSGERLGVGEHGLDVLHAGDDPHVERRRRRTPASRCAPRRRRRRGRRGSARSAGRSRGGPGNPWWTSAMAAASTPPDRPGCRGRRRRPCTSRSGWRLVDDRAPAGRRGRGPTPRPGTTTARSGWPRSRAGARRARPSAAVGARDRR